MPPIRYRFLGQAGFLFETATSRVLLDPYLSDSVADRYGPHLHRRTPCPLSDAELRGIDWVLLTHAHLDHCDPASIERVCTASPGVRFLASAPTRAILAGCGVPLAQVTGASAAWVSLGAEFSVHPVPAAHPAVLPDGDGAWECLGFVLKGPGTCWYHAGDTSPDEEIVRAVRAHGPTLGFLPVNERNYYRDRADILGNMSVREAFAFAEELGLGTVVPIHWDLFAPNSTLPEEIELLHERLGPPFILRFPT